MNNMRNKILSLLVLLLTAATGAWAQSLPSFSDLRNEIVGGGNITLQHDYYKYDFGDPIEITNSGVIDGKGAIIDMEGANISHVFYISANNVTIKNLSIINYTGTGDAIYFSGSGVSLINVVYAVAVSPGSSANTWTLSMPASDVLLTPVYAPTAVFTVENAGTPEEKTLLPTAINGVIAGTDAPIIVEGTVANAGTSTDKQGQVKYFPTTEQLNAAPATSAEGWISTVPTAKDVTGTAKVTEDKTVYVWYYIVGADTPENTDATAENTFNDSDPQCIAVTLKPNVFTLTLQPAPVDKVTVTIGDASATPDQNGKISDVQMGKTVMLAPNTGYKLRKVEVKKTQGNN